jgi:methyltransferase (TIGR00027 family)
MSGAHSRLEALALTALWTAAARACESRRHDRLFDDPWAALLAGGSMVDAYDREIAKPDFQTADLVAIITRYFDDFLLRATRDGIRQVVILGAGLDARAFRLGWPAGTSLYELDQPGLILYKDHRLASLGATQLCARHSVGVDLNGDWPVALREAGFDPSQRSVWLLEGFLYFLPNVSVRNLLGHMAELSAASSRVGIELVNADMLSDPSTRCWHELMSAAGAPWRFTSDRPELLLAEFGWTASVVQPGDGEASFGRWSVPPSGGEAARGPQCLLVTGGRQRSIAAGRPTVSPANRAGMQNRATGEARGSGRAIN